MLEEEGLATRRKRIIFEVDGGFLAAEDVFPQALARFRRGQVRKEPGILEASCGNGQLQDVPTARPSRLG